MSNDEVPNARASDLFIILRSRFVRHSEFVI